MEVGCVIVNWNSADCLEKCLQALREQTAPIREIVVVDNSPGTAVLTELERRYREVSFIRPSRNLGFAAANNIAIRALKSCEWVALVNPDAYLDATWLGEMMWGAKNNPQYAFFGSRLVRADDRNVLDGVGDVYHVSGKVWRKGYGKSVSFEYLEQQEIFSPCAAAALYRRDVLMSVGLFDESFFCYMEDVDLGFRLRLQGHSCMYMPRAIARHVGAATTGGRKSDFAVYHGQRNLVWTFWKNMPGSLFWRYLPEHLLLNIVSFFYYVFRGQGRVVVKAKWDAVKGLPRILRERRNVQRARRVPNQAIRRVLAKGLLTPYFQHT